MSITEYGIFISCMQVFQTLENERKGKVTVFFCGSPAISKILKAKCSEYNFEFRKENF